MNSAINNEMALRYYCAIKAIGWNKPGNKLERTSLFHRLHAGRINRARIRRFHSALFRQERKRINSELVTSGKSVKYVRARKRSYF